MTEHTSSRETRRIAKAKTASVDNELDILADRKPLCLGCKMSLERPPAAEQERLEQVGTIQGRVDAVCIVLEPNLDAVRQLSPAQLAISWQSCLVGKGFGSLPHIAFWRRLEILPAPEGRDSTPRLCLDLSGEMLACVLEPTGLSFELGIAVDRDGPDVGTCPHGRVVGACCTGVDACDGVWPLAGHDEDVVRAVDGGLDAQSAGEADDASAGETKNPSVT